MLKSEKKPLIYTGSLRNNCLKGQAAVITGHLLCLPGCLQKVLPFISRIIDNGKKMSQSPGKNFFRGYG